MGNRQTNNASENAQSSDYSSSLSTLQTTRFRPLKKRSHIEMAGAFLIICILTIVGGTVKANENIQPAASRNNTALNLQTTHTAATSGSSSMTNPSSDSDAPADTSHTLSSPNTISTNITSTTNNGSSSNQLNVNGQSIALPDNGSMQKTISTANGTVTVNSSASQSVAGSATNSGSSNFNITISN